MNALQLKGPQITFEPNPKIELLKKIMLITYVVLETLYKTIFGKYLAVEMERLQCVAGAVLACLLLIEWFRLDKDNKIKWIKRHSIVFIYFAIRVVTFISIGMQYTMLRSVFFEGIYLLVLTELIVDNEFCRKMVFRGFILMNLALNIINTCIYAYCNLTDIVNNVEMTFLHRMVSIYTYVGDYSGVSYCSMYSNPNQIGLMTGIALLISINYLSKDMSILSKGLVGIYYIFSFYCIYYSNCRSAQLMLLVVIFMLITCNKTKVFKNKKKIIVLCMIVCIIFTACIYIIAMTHYEYGWPTLFEVQLGNVSTQRYFIWKDCYYSHQDELLLGCGNMTLEKRDRYQYNLDKGIDKGLDINSSLIDYVGPHNGYIGTISCAGLTGFVAFIMLLLKKISDSKSLNEGYWYLAIVFILGINLFECMMPISKNFVTLYMFLIMSMSDREVKK